MKRNIVISLSLIGLLGAACNNNRQNETTKSADDIAPIFTYKVAADNGDSISLADYQDKVLLIVNVASKCGLTPQYEGLEALYEKYHGRGLEILAFPCNQFHGQEPGSADEIRSFCTLNYNVTFPLMAKIDVNGENESPLYTYLKQQAPYKGCPEEPEEYRNFCEAINQIHQADGNGWDQGDAIKWNFGKFLVSRDGSEILRFEPFVSPSDLEADIERLLQ